VTALGALIPLYILVLSISLLDYIFLHGDREQAYILLPIPTFSIF
jgi:hypothetical protein